AAGGVRAAPGGFELWSEGAVDEPWDAGSFVATVDEPEVRTNLAWFRGSWFDDVTMAWNDVEAAACYDEPPVSGGEPSPGATLFVPFKLAAGESRTIALRLSWHVPRSNLRENGMGAPKEEAA